MDAVLRAALLEDAPYGDITSQVLIPADARATAVLAARVPGVLSGGEVFAAAMKLTDPDADVELLVADGDAFAAGTALARVNGNARAVLLAERVALNLVQRMSAIATKTAEFVALVDGTGARITDTRKTTPGLRVLERYAVRCGGGANHRFGLSDAVLAKDNHLAVLTGGDPSKLTAVLREAKAVWGTPPTSRWRWTAWTRSDRCSPRGWTPSCWTTSPWRTSPPVWPWWADGPGWRPAATSTWPPWPASPPPAWTSSRSAD